MKKTIKLIPAIIIAMCCVNSASAQCCTDCETCPTCSEDIVTEGLKFCESTLPYGDDLLIANFGGETLNPLNQDGLGYISILKWDGRLLPFIPADGSLSAPKGMLVKGDYLLICDVNRVVAYNLKKLKAKPQVLTLPKGELFVNDIVAVEDDIYVSVTNSGNIFKLDGTSLDHLSKQKPTKWLNVVGANGLVSDGKSLYVASYPADGVTTRDNVIYVVRDLQNPEARRFIAREGQWDGLALTPDGKTLYASSWSPKMLVRIDIESRRITPIELVAEFVGAADFSLIGDTIYIPDLPNSKLIVKSF